MDQERQTYIYEVSGKIASQISSTLNHLNNEASILPAVLETSDASTFADCSSLFAGAVKEGGVLLVSDEGDVFNLDGSRATIGNRTLLMSVVFDKQSTFSYETDAQRTDYWVFCQPCDAHMVGGNKIVGVMMTYPAEEFSNEFSMQLFGQQGYALMCDDSGSIRLRPNEADWIGYNFYATILSQGATEDDVTVIQNAFATGEECDLPLTLNGSRWLIHCEGLTDKNLGNVSNLVVMIPIETITSQVSTGMRTAIYSALFVAGVAVLIILVLVFSMRRAAEVRKEEERAAKLEIALRTAEAKSDFLARMSHDIRTPLNAIIGLNYIAAQNEGDPAIIADCNKKLGTSADYLLQILNDVLDMSKIGSGKLDITHASFSMEDLIRNLSTMVGPRAEERGLNFAVTAPDDFGEDFVGDRLRITQILMNLLSNAVKFTPEGGDVSFSCKTRDEGGGRRTVEFAVSDTGIGMSDEYMERLFTPFEQEDAFTADRYGGSGLGLSIVNSLVTLMNGTVKVSSAQGKGSTFTVRLPLETSARSVHAGARGSAFPIEILSGKRVLLAEDNEINQQIVVTILGSMGMEVEAADNGRLALEKYLSVPAGTYDVILTDIRMPEMDGYEFASAIRASCQSDAATIPIAALSANAFEEDVAKSLSNGMNAHLRKPVEVEEMRKVLAQLLYEKGAAGFGARADRGEGDDR